VNMVKKQDAPLAPLDESAAVLSMITRAASDPNVDIDKMERLVQMREREQARQAEIAFNDALNRAQSQMGRIAADAVNPQTRSAYATYGQLDRALRPIYTTEGFALSFDTGANPPEGHVTVLCHASHRNGFTRTYRVDMPVDGKGAKGNDVMTKTHAMGSGMSYGRRYLLQAIFNIAIGQDDDGNGAGSAYVTEQQAATLRDRLDACGANLPAFLRFLKVDSLDAIHAKDYDKAVKAVEAKERAVGK
jgi:hypothetical protein